MTQRSQDLPQDSSDERLQFQNQALLKPHNLHPDILHINFDQDLLLNSVTLKEQEEETTSHKITRLLEEGYEHEIHRDDTTWEQVHTEIMKPEGIPRLKDIQLSECEISDGRLYF